MNTMREEMNVLPPFRLGLIMKHKPMERIFENRPQKHTHHKKQERHQHRRIRHTLPGEIDNHRRIKDNRRERMYVGKILQYRIFKEPDRLVFIGYKLGHVVLIVGFSALDLMANYKEDWF